VYDKQLSSWSDLGALTIHPDSDWDYIKPSWNPWFSDSSHLAYVSNSILVISEPDGKTKRIFHISGQGGLASPSPDGRSVAYLTFESRPRTARPDLTFWGSTIIWILPFASGGAASAITEKNQATTYDLRWLDNSGLVFDRLEDRLFPDSARIWKVSVGDVGSPSLPATGRINKPQ
jgi:hypothetical protein